MVFQDMRFTLGTGFVDFVGSITTMPHLCEYCHKQYASKAKLTQHQRKKHPDIVPPLPPKPLNVKGR
jgi:hypothetical protein